MKQIIDLSVTKSQLTQLNQQEFATTLALLQENNQKFLLDNALTITKKVKVDLEIELESNVLEVELQQNNLCVVLIGGEKWDI